MIDIGHTVGNYRITAKLGEGGMGTVFLAEHPVIGSKVALKAIHPELADNADVFARFVNEAKAVNQIGHDHIIDITDFGTAPTGDYYFMMEYLEGDTLLGRHQAGRPVPPARALNIAAQIADALDASTPTASSTATSSQRTSSSSNATGSATSSRCWTSAWPS